MAVISSQEFARRLLAPKQPNPGTDRDERRDVRLSEAEVEEWLRIFGEQPDEETGD